MLDQSRLLTEQYQDASNLDARIALHTCFSTDKTNWFRWVFNHLELPEKARVLELGCGPAKLWAENAERIPEGWEVTLSDFSKGMLREAEARLEPLPHPFRYEVVDAQSIPFEDAFFDAVIANHMLYHVPDRQRALGEVRRVLKPGGRFYAATNGRAHMRELDELSWFLVPDGMVSMFRAVTHESFGLENAEAQLKEHFNDVTLYRLESALKVTEVEPLVAYVLSMRSADTFKDLPEEVLSERLDAFRAHVGERIASEGAVHITRSTGLFEAR